MTQINPSLKFYICPDCGGVMQWTLRKDDTVVCYCRRCGLESDTYETYKVDHEEFLFMEEEEQENNG